MDIPTYIYEIRTFDEQRALDEIVASEVAPLRTEIGLLTNNLRQRDR